MTRRKFCQLSLAATALTAMPLQAEAVLPLTAEYQLSIVEGKLRAELFLHNISNADLEVQTKGIGAMSLRLVPRQQQAALHMYRVPETTHERAELMSRVGPRPAWVVVRHGERLRFGVFESRQELPVQETRVKIALTLNTKSGQLEFPEADVPISR